MPKNKKVTIIFISLLVVFFIFSTDNVLGANLNSNLSEGLILSYNFDELSGNLIDRVGNNNAIANGDPIYAQEGVVNNAIKVNSTGDWFNITNPSIFGNISNATVSIWVNFFDFETQNYFWNGNLGGDADSGWRLAGITNRLNIDLTNGAMECGIDSGTNSINSEEWYHLAVTFNNGEMKVYVNGILNSTKACSFSVINPVTEMRFGDSGVHAPDMLLEEFGFWNRSLESSEIAQLYNNGNGITLPPSPATPNITTFENVNITNNLFVNQNATIYQGLFEFLGSISNRVKSLFVQEINTVNITVTDKAFIPGLILLEGVDNADQEFLVNAENVSMIALENNIGVDAVLYEAWGEINGTGDWDWRIEVHDCNHNELKNTNIKSDVQTSSSESIPFFISGYDLNPENCEGYHLSLNEGEGSAIAKVKFAKLEKIMQ